MQIGDDISLFPTVHDGKTSEYIQIKQRFAKKFSMGMWKMFTHRPEQSSLEKFRVGYIAIFSRKTTKSSQP